MRVLLAALMSGILFYLSQGLADVWALAWLAYGDMPRWQVLLASLAAFAVGQTYLVQCYWGQLPPSIIAPMVVTMCVTFAIAIVFSGEALLRLGSPWAALLGLPGAVDGPRARNRDRVAAWRLRCARQR